jgi:hypothetical protein
MNSVWAAFSLRPQPGQPTAWHDAAHTWAAVTAPSRSSQVVLEWHDWWGELDGASGVRLARR